MSCEKVAHFFGDSPRSVVNWARRFDRQGLAGLAEGNHSGRPCSLSAEQIEEVGTLIRKPPSDTGLEVNLLGGKKPAQWFQSRFQRRLGIRQSQRIFHR